MRTPMHSHGSLCHMQTYTEHVCTAPRFRFYPSQHLTNSCWHCVNMVLHEDGLVCPEV